MSSVSSDAFGCLTCSTAASVKCDWARMPSTCPTRTQTGVAHDTAPYLEPERHALMVAADATPFTEERLLRSRVEELVVFARARGVTKVGVAFCVSLIREAQRLGEILADEGFVPELICCRVGLVAQVGLCIGHDLILQEECEAPVTALIVKDRTLDHHPVQALRPGLSSLMNLRGQRS
jgi:uncharacterized metal-binding protein